MQHCPVLPHRRRLLHHSQVKGHRELCLGSDGAPPAAAALLPGKAVAAGLAVSAMPMFWGGRRPLGTHFPSQVPGTDPLQGTGCFRRAPEAHHLLFFPLAAIPPARSRHRPKQSAWEALSCTKTPRLAPAGLFCGSRDGTGDGTAWEAFPTAGGRCWQEGGCARADQRARWKAIRGMAEA